MKTKKNFAQWISLFLIGVALIIVYKVFDNLGQIGNLISKVFSILTPFVVGFAFAFVLYSPVNWIEQRLLRFKSKFFIKAARPLAVTITYLLTLGLLALLFYIAVPALISAVAEFVSNVPAYYEKVIGFINDRTHPGSFLESLDLQQRAKEVYAFLQEQVTVDRILSYLSGVLNFTSSVVEVVMAFIVSVYMLLGRESLFSATKAVVGLFFKPKTIDFFSTYAHKTAKIFYNYFYSQLLDALVVGVLATIGFLLARMPNAAVMGTFLGLMNMIPYFGALIGGVLAVLIALLSGNFYGALFVGIYILAMQQIDANIIQPRIVGQTVGIKAIYVLLGITVGGGLFGFWGVFLGAPFIAVVQMFITDYINYRNQKAKVLKKEV
ncbi:MAG: AI-2E family transporter [Clostridia bacterium]|nr:AI-2E family transporter [Clostridia bacterium]